MCFVYGSIPPAQRGPLGTLWWHVACCPQRLLGAVTAIGALASIALVSSGLVGARAMLLLLPALALPAMSGIVLHLLPQWSERTPLHYMRTLTLFNGYLLATLLLLHGRWLGPGLVLLAATFAFLLTTVRDYLPWIRQRYQRRSRLASGGLFLLAAISLVTPLLSGV